MKQVNYWKLCLAVWLGMIYLSNAQNKNNYELPEDEMLIELTTDRFTLPNLHVTPQGNHIVFDVLGDIYKVPIEGGKAELLIQDNNWKRGAKLSSDGKTLAYVSDETGDFQVWSMDLKTKEKQVYPTIESIHFPLYAYWDKRNNLIIPDSKGILCYNKNGDEAVLRETKENERTVINAIPQQISINKKGTKAYISSPSNFIEFDLEEKRETIVEHLNLKEFDHIKFFRFNNSGNAIVGYTEGDYRTNSLFYINLETKKYSNLISLESTSSSTNLHFSFDFIDDTTIILDKEGEIVRMNLETGEYESISIEVEVQKMIKKSLQRKPQYINDSIITASVLRNPITRSNLDTIYFSAFGKMHSYAKETKAISEFFPEKDQFETSPSLSPDDKYLLYSTWNATEMGHVYAREIKTGKEHRLTKTPGRYINPLWSKNNSIIFLSDKLATKEGYSGASPVSSHQMGLNKINLSKRLRVKSIKEIMTFNVATPTPNRYYSSISVDKSGDKVYFMALDTRKGISHPPELVEYNIKTNDTITSYLLPNYIDEVSVSPDEKNVAFIHSNQIFIDKFPFQPEIVFSKNSDLIPTRYHTFGGYIESVDLSKNAKPIYKVAPSYLFWKDKHTLMWGSAEEVYTYDLSTGKTEKIAEINVEKPRDIPKGQYALTNARIITMNKQDKIIEKGIVLVNDNRIEVVGEVDKVTIPRHYKIIDLKGKTIMPGIIDTHAHYTLHLNEIQSNEYYYLLSNLSYGITTIYEPSVNTLDSRDLSQMIETGQIIGPRVFSSGNIIMDKPSQYGYKQINSLQDAAREVLSLKKLGVHGPIKDYSISNRKVRKWLRTAARNNDMTITADQVKTIPAITRVIDGYTAIEHVISRFTSVHDDFLKPIYESKIHYTPTLTTESPYYLIYTDSKWDSKFCDDRTLFDGVNKYSTQSKFTKRCDDYLKYSYYARNELNDIFFKKQINVIKKIIKNKGKVSVGAHGNFKAGINTHWEMWFFTYTGLANYEALKAATINGAEKLSLDEELGSIEEGKLADLIILNENPIDHIYNTVNIHKTIINGKIYEID